MTACNKSLGSTMRQLQQIYQKRLNSLSNTFTLLLNNLENNYLFRQLQVVQLSQKIGQINLNCFKQSISSYRMQYLKTIIQQMIHKNQQKIISKLETQNFELKSELQYYKKIKQCQNPTIQSPQETSFYNYQQNSNFSDNFEDDYQNNLQFRSKNNFYLQNSENSRKPKQILKSKLFLKFSSEQNSQQISKRFQSPEGVSLIVPLKQNSSGELQDNYISSIQPVSQLSSIQSSEKRQRKVVQKQNQNQVSNGICMTTLREQLEKLKKSNKFATCRINKDNKQLKKYRQREFNDQNQQNQEPLNYDFKYFKI